MRCKVFFHISLLLTISVLVCFAPTIAQTPVKEAARISSTEKYEFGMRGTIQIIDSFGLLHVEGWDQPEVEISVARATQKKYEPKDLARRVKDLELVKINVESISETAMLIIRTTFPSRTPTRLMRGKSNLHLEYKIKVPRTCHLFIKHDTGEVVISNIDGNIEATNRIGELALRLPEDGQYSIDAKVKMGDVSSAFITNTQRQKTSVADASVDSSSTRNLFLRVGIGDIHIEKTKSRQN